MRYCNWALGIAKLQTETLALSLHILRSMLIACYNSSAMSELKDGLIAAAAAADQGDIAEATRRFAETKIRNDLGPTIVGYWGQFIDENPGYNQVLAAAGAIGWRIMNRGTPIRTEMGKQFQVKDVGLNISASDEPTGITADVTAGIRFSTPPGTLTTMEQMPVSLSAAATVYDQFSGVAHGRNPGTNVQNFRGSMQSDPAGLFAAITLILDGRSPFGNNIGMFSTTIYTPRFAFIGSNFTQNGKLTSGSSNDVDYAAHQYADKALAQGSVNGHIKVGSEGTQRTPGNNKPEIVCTTTERFEAGYHGILIRLGLGRTALFEHWRTYLKGAGEVTTILMGSSLMADDAE